MSMARTTPPSAAARVCRSLEAPALLILLIAAWSGCDPPEAERRSPTATTLSMIARLEEIRRREEAPAAEDRATEQAGPWRFNRPQLIPLYQREIEETKAAERLLGLHLQLASELLWDGRTPEALEAFAVAEAIVLEAANAQDPAELTRLRVMLREHVAIALLRLGEQANCVRGHNADSCLVPIQGGGIHKDPTGPRGAIEVLTAALGENPRDHGARWLLNLAYMTLGEHPARVPPAWLIPPSVFASEHDVGRFPDVAPAVGVDAFGLAGGSIVEDLDRDGDLDLLCSGWSLRTEAAGLLGAHAGQAAVWGDLDNDGLLDLFLGNEDDGSRTRPSQLFHNRGDGTFSDWAPLLGLADLGFVKGAAWGDYNNDGREDLYVSRRRAPNLLFRNDGPAPRTGAAGEAPWRCTEVSRVAGVEEPLDSFATWFWDYDNDGWLDIFAAGFDNAAVSDIGALALGLPQTGEFPRLYRNQGDGTFEDVTSKARVDRVILVMGATAPWLPSPPPAWYTLPFPWSPRTWDRQAHHELKSRDPPAVPSSLPRVPARGERSPWTSPRRVWSRRRLSLTS
jgi:hypothetical protein